MDDAMMGNGMATLSPALFLREAEVRRGIELLFAAQAELARAIAPLLARAELGQAHYRALAAIGRTPNLTVGALRLALRLTKQSLHRTLTELVARDLVEVRIGRDDRRQRLLRLTEAGRALDAELFELLRQRMATAYAQAGQQAVGGYWAVLSGLD